MKFENYNIIVIIKTENRRRKNKMETNVKATTTTRGMLADQTVLSDGQANTITYNTEADQINQPNPQSDPMQALWKGQPVANQLGLVEEEKPEVEEESETLGDETLKTE